MADINDFTMSDGSPRPLKRTRTSPQPKELKPLPPQHLLLTLPSLVHPPGHKYHVLGLYRSLKALGRCLTLDGGMDAPEECRVWTAFAEIGMKAVEASVASGGSGEWEWAKGLENEVSGETVSLIDCLWANCCVG
jgi:hypothetical protein